MPSFDIARYPRFAARTIPIAAMAPFLRTAMSTEVMVVMNQKVRALVFAAGAALLSTGCYATAGTSGVAYADMDGGPIVIDVATYPHSYYEGRTVYYYQDRWYYQEGGRWSYYRDEPPALYQHRGNGRGAPAAHDERNERNEHEQQERAQHEQQERAQHEQQERAQHEQQERAQHEQQERAQREREEEEHRKHAKPPPHSEQGHGPKDKHGPRRPDEH